MYKIYINNTPVLLNPDSGDLPAIGADPKQLILHYSGKRKFLLNAVDQLEKSARFTQVFVCGADEHTLWSDFQSLFKIVPAAGGVVLRNDGKVLFIYRRKKWDLPKGKMERSETPQEAALREVREETGLSTLDIVAALPDTWHTYRQDGKRILKQTHWFLMRSTKAAVLHPQHEEDIEAAEWLEPAAFLAQPPGNTFNSIRDLVQAALSNIPPQR